jgi:excisionase family DNA binding protein
MSAHEEGKYTTSEVAAMLDVSPSTIRRWLKEKFLPEPGWGRNGRRKQRLFSDAWVASARRKLEKA